MALTDPHHDGSGYYLPEQAPNPGDTVPVFVPVPVESQVDGLWARALHGGGSPLRPDADGVVSRPGDGPAFQVWQLA
jgi:hypothetical protein